MSQTLTVSLVGGVLGTEVREGVSEMTKKPWSITEVLLYTTGLDKFTVTWPDGVAAPADGDGIRVKVELEGTRYGLRGKVKKFEPAPLPPALEAMVQLLVESEAA